MEHVLQAVTGSGMMSMLDGFLGHNQVAIAKKDMYKTAFTTPWGTYAYIHMPFGIIGATFQRAKDFAFLEYLFKFIVVFQDDIIVFVKIEMKIFDRCRSLGILLNPKKSVMGVFEGKLLGRIVS